MGNSIADKAEGGHHIRCETPKPRMAKAVLHDPTLREKRAEYGKVLRRASEIAGLNRDETAQALHVDDPSQISKWWSGDENPQTWRYRQHPKLRLTYLEAQAECEAARDPERVKLETTIKVSR